MTPFILLQELLLVDVKIRLCLLAKVRCPKIGLSWKVRDPPSLGFENFQNPGFLSLGLNLEGNQSYSMVPV